MFTLKEDSLTDWYLKNRRELPWRRDEDPYHVLVSEMMLQQTRIETVIPYYERFIEELPDFAALSACDDDRLHKLWEGLGYYSRVRNLKKCAQEIVSAHGGKCPDSYEKLIRLPGIGEYTAAAILSISFHQPYPVVDGNVLRVAARLAADDHNVLDPSVKKRLQEELTVFLRERDCDPSMFNQAIMELGEKICLPKGKTDCDACPLHDNCSAFARGIQQELPIRLKKQKRSIEHKTVLILEKEGLLGIEYRNGSGLLSGMYGFPMEEGFLGEKEISDKLNDQGFKVISLTELPGRKHIFTHKEWQMKAWHIIVEGSAPESLIFADRDAIRNNYALPSAYRKWNI